MAHTTHLWLRIAVIFAISMTNAPVQAKPSGQPKHKPSKPPTAKTSSKTSQPFREGKISPQVIAALKKLASTEPVQFLQTPSESQNSPFVLRTAFRKKEPKGYPELPWSQLKDVKPIIPPKSPDIIRGAPRIIQTPPPNIIAPRGQRVALTIEAAPNKFQVHYAWFVDDQIVCVHAACTVSTEHLLDGDHKIVAQVFNVWAAYNIESVLTLNSDSDAPSKQELRVPPQPVADLKPPLGASDEYVIARIGFGYFGNGKTLTVADKIAQHLQWNETIKTVPQAVLKLGIGQDHEHYLFGDSEAKLIHKPDRYAIELTEGTVRSRNLAARGSIWTVITEEGFEADGDSRADLILQKKTNESTKKLNMVCLRGRCRLRVPRDLFDSEAYPPLPSDSVVWNQMRTAGYLELGEKIATYNLLAGEEIDFRINSNQIAYVHAPDGEALQDWINQSTPEYLNLESWPDFSSSEGLPKFNDPIETRPYFHGAFSPNLEKPRFVSTTTVTQIKTLLEESDPLAVLEILSQFPTLYQDAPLYQIIKGQIYLKLGLYDKSAEIFNYFTKRDNFADIAAYALALSKLGEKKFEQANKIFQDIKDSIEERQQLILYYRGLCRNALGWGSIVQFKHATWYNYDPIIVSSAHEFLKVAREDQNWFGSLKLEFGFDNNPLRQGSSSSDSDITNNEDAEVQSLPTGSAIPYGLAISLKRRVNSDRELLAFLGMSLDYGGYSNPLYQAVASRFDTRIFMENRFYAGNPTEPSATIIFNPYYVQLKRGSVPYKGFGLGLGVRIDAVPFKPGVELGSSQYIDPNPELVKSFDPLTSEPATNPDRSGRMQELLLTLIPWESNLDSVELKLGTTELRRRAEESNSESFEGNILRIRHQKVWFPRWTLVSGLEYLSRKFKFSSTHRTDSSYELKSKIQWNLTPSSAFSLGIAYKTNNSSENSESYNRMVATIRYVYEI